MLRRPAVPRQTERAGHASRAGRTNQLLAHASLMRPATAASSRRQLSGNATASTPRSSPCSSRSGTATDRLAPNARSQAPEPESAGNSETRETAASPVTAATTIPRPLWLNETDRVAAANPSATSAPRSGPGTNTTCRSCDKLRSSRQYPAAHAANSWQIFRTKIRIALASEGREPSIMLLRTRVAGLDISWSPRDFKAAAAPTGRCSGGWAGLT